MELNNILKLIDAVSESSLSSFSLEDGQVKLSLSNVKTDDVKSTDAGRTDSLYVCDEKKPVNNVQSVKNNNIAVSDTEQLSCDNEKKVVSPLVGTFYNSASPDDEPMVNVGDTVKKGQVIGIIEAMKLMNEIESEYDGVVKEILVNNEDVVEYGQPLFVIA